MQMIKIVNVPMEYKMEIEHARLEMKNEPIPKADVSRAPGELHIQSKQAKMRMDTTDMRASMGLKNTGDFLKDTAIKGRQEAQKAAGTYMSDVKQMADSQNGINNIVAGRLMNPSPQTQMVFLPSVGPNISWEPASLQLDYEPGTVTFDWKLLQNSMEYIPGKFHLDILQYPDVEIEYLAGPNYVPASADPNYKEK